MMIRQFEADFSNLNAIRDLVGEKAKEWGLSDAQVYELQLATDEAASNIIEHAYEKDGEKSLEIRVAKEFGGISVTLIDSGKPYQPDFIKLPSKEAKVTEAEIGGLGLFFIHRLMDEVKYHYDPTKGNVLKLKKYFSKSSIKKRRKPADIIERILELEQQLIDSPTLENRREIIVTALRGILGDGADVWLDVDEIRLPGQFETIFLDQPKTALQRTAIKRKKIARSNQNGVYHIACPVFGAGNIQGVIEVWRESAGKFSPGEERAIQGLAGAISAAYNAWHKVDIERWRLRQLSLVQKVAAELIREPDIERLSEKAVGQIFTGLKVYGVGLFLLDPSSNGLVCMAAVGGASREGGTVRSFTYSADRESDLPTMAVVSGEIEHSTSVEPGGNADIPELLGSRSRLAIPLKTETSVIGVLDIHSEKVDGFHQVDILVLRALADSIALAVEGSLSIATQREQTARLTLITEVSKQITSILDIKSLMNEVGKIVHEKLGYPFVHLFTVHHNRRQIRYEGGAGERSAILEGYVIDLDDPEGFIPWAARHGETILSGNVGEDPRYMLSPLPPYNTVSEITVPLLFNGVVNGILDVQSDDINAFSDEDRVTLETLGDSVASAIRNAELYHSEQWRRQSVDSLREVAGLLSKNARVDQVLDAILTELERNLPADISSIWLLEEDDLFCAASHGADPKRLDQIKYESADAFSVLAKMVISETTVIRAPEEAYSPAAVFGRFKTDHSAIYVPLAIANTPLGVLTLTHHTPGRYGHEAAGMTSTFASYASVAIENARLFDNAQQQAYASATLLQIAQAVVSLNTLDEIFATITRILPILVGVEKVAIIVMTDPEHAKLAQHYGLTKEFVEHYENEFFLGELPIIAKAIQTGEAQISSDGYFGEENWNQINFGSDRGEDSVFGLDDRLLAVIPLLLKNDTFGVLLIEEAEGGKRFRDRRFEILNGVAQQITLAIQNENYQDEKIDRERLETEVNVARQIQKTFLPSNLYINADWQIAADWLTAKQMGGDLFDLIEVSEGKFGLFIADVADKGIGAALFMASTRTLLRAAASLFADPAEMITWLNRKLYPDCENGMFVTAFLGILDIETGVMNYVNAGHNPPIVVSEGNTTTLTKTGMALGVMDTAAYGQGSVNLRDHDVVCFYTDGITEAFSPTGEMFGEERLKVLLAETEKNCSAKDILEDILFAVREMTNNSGLSDDISLMVIKKSPVIGAPQSSNE